MVTITKALIIPTIKLISPSDTDSATVLALLSTTHSYMYFMVLVKKISGGDIPP